MALIYDEKLATFCKSCDFFFGLCYRPLQRETEVWQESRDQPACDSLNCTSSLESNHLVSQQGGDHPAARSFTLTHLLPQTLHDKLPSGKVTASSGLPFSPQDKGWRPMLRFCPDFHLETRVLKKQWLLLQRTTRPCGGSYLLRPCCWSPQPAWVRRRWGPDLCSSSGRAAAPLQTVHTDRSLCREREEQRGVVIQSYL